MGKVTIELLIQILLCVVFLINRKKGAQLHKLENDTNCKINCHSVPPQGFPDDKFVTISGRIDDVHQCQVIYFSPSTPLYSIIILLG